MQNLLAQIDIDPTIESRMELKDLDGKSFNVPDEEKIIISLLGTNSKAWEIAVEKYPKDEDDRSEKIMASIVTGWENVKTPENLPMECTFDNVFKAFKRYPELLSQCDFHIAKKSNYLKKS